MAQCPGQDRRFWKPEDIYEVDCPKCGAKVEFWKDDVYRRCRKCNHRFRNPKLDLGCAQWCHYAKYCLGRDINSEITESFLPQDGSRVQGKKEENMRDVLLNNDRKAHIKTVLKRLHSAPDNAVFKEQAKSILRQVGPTDLAVLEQELINEGMSRDEIMGLCDVHLEAMGESLKNNQITPPAWHPIYTMMEEHKIIFGYLEKLKEVMRELKNQKEIEKARHYVTVLAGLAHHLVEAEKHHQREEEVIFPMLEKYGITEPPEIMRMEHTELRQRKKNLFEIAQKPPADYYKFIGEVEKAGQYLVEELAKHIFKEDNILYQAALKTFKPEEWNEIKKKCDAIGYCCFTPLEMIKTDKKHSK